VNSRIVSALTPARAIVAAVLVAACVVHFTSRTIPFDSDEANHANLALRQYQDLAAGNFTDFLRHSYRTGQFPFFHGWTVVPFFAALGATEFAARIAQSLHFVVGVAATALAAWRACGDHRRAGGLAGALFALSPHLAVLAGLCMLETPGAAMTAVALFCFGEAIRAEGRKAVLWDAATAGAVLLTWFTKLNYGMWVLPAIGLGYLVPGGRNVEWKRTFRGLAVYVGVLVLVLGAWYTPASQRAALHGFLTNPAQAVSVVKDDPSFHLPEIGRAHV
jgi:4-amino-4-deoxy-L-arabinose transferase-like glycosyltransferase